MGESAICISVIFSIIAVVAAVPVKNQEGYNVGCVKCHPLDENKINVHLIPHSHDDVGWLKTVDEYFYGVNSGQISVSLIISSVVEALKRNPDRRFIQVETAYFYKWWQENENIREDFKTLVENGQIEMVNGAWSMNDEACVNYQSTIDQFTWGLRKIEETVGKCGRPRVGWQIDPFGHSREHASLLSQMGYDAVLFARMDHDDKNNRIKNADLDFLWKGSANIDDSIIFGSCFPNALYNEPDWFCWDINCGDDQIVDNPKSVIYNVEEKVNKFAKVLKNFTTYYSHDVKNILVTMGGDFQYQAAGYNFGNMDRLIKGFQKFNDEFNVIYSTPSCYIKSVNDARPTLTLKVDDFFPYSDQDFAFWAGYYTSRPTVKRFERTGHNILQAMKQMYAFSTTRSYDDKLNDLKEVMGVLQHHDAITGTEQQHVTSDYVRMLTAAIREAEEPVGEIIMDILQSDVKLNFSSCLLSNMSICSTSQKNEKFVIAVYNPLAWNTTHYIRLPVEDGTYEINGPDGPETYDLLESLFSFDYISIKGEKPSTNELVFAAKDIPPLGFKVYHIQKIKKQKANWETIFKSSVFEIDDETNLLKSVTLNGVSANISQNFFFYQSNDGFSDISQITSGAYIFRPKNNEPNVMENATIVRQYSGNLVEEIHQQWENVYANIYQSIRWYKNENYIELDWIVGDINLDNIACGKEVISRFTISNFDNKDTFYTDSNGREMIKRIKNKRFTYDYNSTQEPVASNYYPVTSRIVLKDEERDLEVAVLTDRSQGGTSLDKGQFELMVHRRIIFDDNRGVSEGLDEDEFDKGLYVRGSHYLVLGSNKNLGTDNKSTAAQERILAQKKLLQPWIGLSTTDLSFDELKNKIKLSYGSLTKELPENVNILTLEPWTNSSYLLRIEHIMEKGEDSVLSKSVQISDIENMFKGIKITKKTETALAAHVTLSELKERGKYSWIIANGTSSSKYVKDSDGEGEITLNPMEIKTFILKAERMENSGCLKYFSYVLYVVILMFVFVN